MKHYFSITLMVAGVKNILMRFPFSAIIALLGSVIAISLTYDDLIAKNLQPYFIRLIYLSSLAIPLFISIRLFLESSVFKPIYFYVTKLAAIILLFFFYLQIPTTLNSEFYIRFFITNFAFHLLVTFIGFVALKNNQDELRTWHFNKIIFLRFFGALLATIVLFAGLALALVAIDVLLDFNVDEDNYFRLWILLTGIFCTYFFLAGIPHHNKIDTTATFPKSLKIFIQYVIIPLIAVFSIILYLYLFKIIINWNIPKGWVIYLVSGYFALGLLTTILLFPIRNHLNSKIFIFFKHSFYYTTIPFIIVFFIAILIRTQQYGFTESRVLILLLGVWMLIINLYILFVKNYKLFIIPLSFVVISVLSVYGPWNIFRISEYSQRNQLIQLLKDNNMLQNNKAIAATKPIVKQDGFRIIDIIDYFSNKEKILFLQPVFTQNLDSLLKIDTTNSYYFKKEAILKILNISPADYYSNNKNNFYFSNENYKNIFAVQGYSHLISLNENNYYYSNDTIKWGKKIINTETDSLEIATDFNTAMLKISLNNKTPLFINLQPMLMKCDSITKDNSNYFYNIPEEFLTINFSNDSIKLKLIFNTINGNRVDSTKYELENYSGTLLLKY